MAELGRRRRVPPLACAAMLAILAAPAGDPATTEGIIGKLGRWPFPAVRVCLALSRLEHSGWVTTEWTGQDRVYRPAYFPGWYEPRIGPPRPSTATAGEKWERGDRSHGRAG